MQSSYYTNFSNDFFKEGIINYIKKQFEEYSKCIDIIYSSNFEQRLIRSVYFEKIEMIKSIIESNRLSKLWLVYADTIQTESNKLNNLFKKEINSKTSFSSISGFKDKDLANINLVKSQLVSLVIITCIKVNINKDDMSILKESQAKIIDLFTWLNTFAQYKSLSDECGLFIKEIILKLPLLVTSQTTMMNPIQLKWLGEIFVLLNINKEWYEKELNEIIELNEKKRNIFGKLMQAAKENPKPLSRSRMQSIDKNDNAPPKEKNEDKTKDNKIYRYFKPLSNQTPKKKERNDDGQNNDENKSKSIIPDQNKEKTIIDLKGSLINMNVPSQSLNSFTFGEESIANDNQLNNIMNEDGYSRYSDSNYSKREVLLNQYHYQTSYSNLKLFRNYSNISSSGFSVNSLNAYSNPIPGLYDSNICYHKSFGGGINSLLKSKMNSYLNIPTIHKSRHLSRSRDKEYSLQKKLTNRIQNDENYNSQNMSIATEPKKDTKVIDFKNIIRKNFYQINNEEEENKSEPPSPIFQKEKSPDTQLKSTSTKTKQTTKEKKLYDKEENDDEILVYRTPNKITFLPHKDSISPCTTRKNLLTLFQQVNK